MFALVSRSQTTSECRVETNAEAEANAEEATPRREAEQNQKSRAHRSAEQRPDQRREQREQSAGRDEMQNKRREAETTLRLKTGRVPCSERKMRELELAEEETIAMRAPSV